LKKHRKIFGFGTLNSVLEQYGENGDQEHGERSEVVGIVLKYADCTYKSALKPLFHQSVHYRDLRSAYTDLVPLEFLQIPAGIAKHTEVVL
jgi:hypothetical protein